MKRKYNIIIYSIIWAIAIIYLLLSLYHNMGNARIINYTGITRGATQRLVKVELNGYKNEKLLQYLDGILIELQTGKGNNNLERNGNAEFQMQLKKMQKQWDIIKAEITNVRNGGSKDALFELSEDYFEMTNKAVSIVEKDSTNKVQNVMSTLFVYLLISLGFMYLWNRLSRKAVHDATYIDSLTSVHNLAGFEIHFEEILKKANNNLYVLIEMDINNFKYFNDVYGYDMGNTILKTIAAYLKSITRDNETCGRIGSNSFLLLVQKDHPLFHHFRDKVNHEVSSKLQLGERIHFATGAYFVNQEEGITENMDKANIALKASKSQGGDHVVWYDEKLTQLIQKQNALINQMHASLEKEEFKLYLQPKFNIHNLKIISAEALVRWIQGDTIIMPQQFIPLFEKNGYIVDLDFYMLKQTCIFINECCERDKNYNVPISVNFSRVTLLHNTFLENFISIVEEYNVKPHLLELEITESAFNDIGENAMHILNLLKEKNFSLSMDDFGAGYSSLSLLISIPINTLKLDKSFLKEGSHNPKTKKILSSLVEMAHKLGLQAICEGVETSDDVSLLNSIHCDFGQGYYFSRPIFKNDFIEKYLLNS